MNKLVNGKLIPLTPEEESARALSDLKNTTPSPYHKWENDAWVEDLDYAKSIRMDELRVMRFDLFDILGIEQLKAEDSGNTTKLAAVRVKRQAVRDMPQNETWVNCNTCEDIANYTPAILTEDFTQL